MLLLNNMVSFTFRKSMVCFFLFHAVYIFERYFFRAQKSTFFHQKIIHKLHSSSEETNISLYSMLE